MGALFAITGRAGRLHYLLVVLTCSLCMSLLYAAVQPLCLNKLSLPLLLLGFLVVLVVLPALRYVQICATLKRLHDVDLSGWYVVLVAIPYLSHLVMAFLLLWPGTRANNRFDPSPSTL